MPLKWSVPLMIALVWVLCATAAQAQSCRKVYANRLAGGQDFTISTVAMPVLLQNPSRCQAMIINGSSGAVRCADTTNDQLPTPTIGVPVGPGQALQLELEGQGLWQCISVTGASITISTVESLP